MNGISTGAHVSVLDYDYYIGFCSQTQVLQSKHLPKKPAMMCKNVEWRNGWSECQKMLGEDPDIADMSRSS